MSEKQDTGGGAAFPAMIVILVIMVVACIILPLAVPNFSKQDWAVPLMGIALVLPFIHFFVFGAILKKR